MTPERPRDRTGDGAGERPLDADAVFDALATQRRRHVVAVLRSSDGAVDIEELARQVVARERTPQAPPVSPDDVRRATARLYHADLPKLTDAGLVEYDGRRREVRSLVDGDDLSAVLADGFERPGI